MNQTVAVTGATGFIGKYIIDNLLARGFHVRALTRTARAHVNDNLIWVRGSLEDTHSLSELVAGASAVVHCAGQVRGHKEEIFTRCNVDGSLRLMQAAKESGFCQRFLFISSLAARHPELSWYANSKHVAEQRLTAMADEITLGIFRPTAVYGPGDKELKPLFDWMLRGLLPRLGAPDTQLSFLHVTDFAQAVPKLYRRKPMNYAMASPAAMTGNAYSNLPPTPVAVPFEWLVFLCRYSPALRISVPR